jgi:putative MATE family efflux protein
VRRELDRTIVRLAVPALGALAIEPLYVVVDTIIVGRLGTTELAGLAIAAQILTVLAGMVNFLAYATTQRLAHQRGAGRPDLAAVVGVQSLWLAAAIGLPLAVLLGVGAESAASALGATGDVLDVATLYLRISAVGIPALLTAIAAHGILRGERDMMTPLRVVLMAAAANVVIEVVMVFGLGWGVAGSAWSTVIVQWGAATVYLALLRPRLVAAPTRAPIPAELRAMLTAGALLVVRVLALLAAFTLATATAARTDDATLAAHQIVMTMFLLLALVLDALAVPAQTLVAEAVGANDRPLVGEVGRRVLALSTMCGVVIGLALLALAPLIPHVFSSDSAVVSRATTGLVFLAVALVPGALTFGLDGILIGEGRYRVISVVMAGALVVFVVALVPTWRRPDWGIGGIWLALTIWMLARAVGMWMAWRRPARPA